MSDIEDFIKSAQFDVCYDNASEVIDADALREWFSRWQAAQQNSESEPVAWMFQHEDTGMVSIIDLQQIEWGYEAANPRWKKVSALYTTPQPVVDVNQQLVVDKYEKLEPALESLVDLCNNLNIGTYDEVIAAEAALEQLYVARWRQKNKRHGAAKGGE